MTMITVMMLLLRRQTVDGIEDPDLLLINVFVVSSCMMLRTFDDVVVYKVYRGIVFLFPPGPSYFVDGGGGRRRRRSGRDVMMRKQSGMNSTQNHDVVMRWSCDHNSLSISL